MDKMLIHPLAPSTVPDLGNSVVDKTEPRPMVFGTDEKIHSLQDVLTNMVEPGLDSKFSVLSSLPSNFGGPWLNVSRMVLPAFSLLSGRSCLPFLCSSLGTFFHPMQSGMDTVHEVHLHLFLVLGQIIFHF